MFIQVKLPQIEDTQTQEETQPLGKRSRMEATDGERLTKKIKISVAAGVDLAE